MSVRRAKLGAKQKKLLEFLRANSGKVVTEEAILKATTRKPRSFRVDLGNGHYDPYLREVSTGRFRVTAPRDLDERAFLRQVSQTAAHRELGACFEHPLAKKLVQKARDNFVLALELYNRPSLENRLDAFAQLFCTAWEQLLKAEILGDRGEEAVFLPQKQGRRRESISLAKCIEVVFDDPKNPVARNLTRIAELRHGATHLLMPETAAPVSWLFQAGVINFARRFRHVTGEAILPESAGLLSLVGAAEVGAAVDLKKLYGKVTAEEIRSFRDGLEEEIAAVDDDNFAVTVRHELVLTKKQEKGDISLTAAANADVGLQVVEKAVSVSKSHPHFTREATEAIAAKLGHKFTSNDFQAVVDVLGWKKADNEFHHHEERFGRHCYSSACIDAIVSKVQADSGFLDKAREKLRRKRKARTRAG